MPRKQTETNSFPPEAGATRIVNDGYELVGPASLVPHPRNPNKSDLDPIIESMAENGFYGALIVQKSTRRILKGEHTWKSAMERGMGSIPVIWADVDDATALRILLADNRIAEFGERDANMLAGILAELALSGEETLRGTGYDLQALDDLKAELSANETKVQAAVGAAAPPQQGMDYNAQHAVLVVCKDEEEQERVYNELKEAGYECKVVSA